MDGSVMFLVQLSSSVEWSIHDDDVTLPEMEKNINEIIIQNSILNNIKIKYGNKHKICKYTTDNETRMQIYYL